MATASDEERREELESLAAIFPELVVDTSDPESLCASIELAVAPNNPLLIRFQPVAQDLHNSHAATRKAVVEHDLHLSHLPPITLQVKLTREYPINEPPQVHLSTSPAWLPREKTDELEKAASALWDDYGRCQILYSYIDHLQQAAERSFDLAEAGEGCLSLSSALEQPLVSYDSQKRREIFEAGTYDCGVCLDPKRGTMCYQMKRCGHIYCRQCLQDFYNNAISEGDISGVRCMDPECGKDPKATAGQKRAKKERLVHPSELLDMGIEEAMVRRFVEMKRKKRLEADKSTVYCPRTWCQGAAKSAKYPPIPVDLRAYAAEEALSDAEGEQVDNAAPSEDNKPNNRIPPNPSDRLAVCEKCSFAFCQVCYMGWHGPFARCFPRDPNELSAEEKASYEYIRLHTSPCAYCNVPVQKTMGCNHMRCFQCNTHFCYLCGAWLEPTNPYQHFNKEGTPCFQRLWELEGGDDGQAPGDGAGFAGGRGWEQLAIEVAREADEAENAAAAAALQAQEEEDREIEHLFPNAPDPPHVEVPLAVAMAQVQLVRDAPPAAGANPRRGQRRARNPFPAMPQGNGAAQRVREHERGVHRRPAAARQDDIENRQQAELQRFLEMAQRDEEDGWDSDELGDNDEGFMIR
jgi:E3 ubiquitin-protein ligase RNF14